MHITPTLLTLLLGLSSPLTALPTDTSLNPRSIFFSRFGTGEKGDKCSKVLASDTKPLCGPCFKCDFEVRTGRTCLPSTKRQNFLKDKYGPNACSAGWSLQSQNPTDQVVQQVYEIDLVDNGNLKRDVTATALSEAEGLDSLEVSARSGDHRKRNDNHHNDKHDNDHDHKKRNDNHHHNDKHDNDHDHKKRNEWLS